MSADGLDFEVPVSTSIPAPQYRLLVDAARANKTTVGLLVRECVRRAVAKPAKKGTSASPAELDHLRALNAEGWSDSHIARVLNRPQPTVSKWRRQLGLPSHYTGHLPPTSRSERAA